MFEANPLVANILKTNAIISLGNVFCKVYKFALGSADSTSILVIPKHNWGGAFINDSHNSYDQKLLAIKDGYNSINYKNYIRVPIQIKSSVDILKKLFSSFVGKKLYSGVIKIDVEGYESVVLNAIAKSLPKKLKLMIVFESWDEKFNMNEILKIFDGRASAYKITTYSPWHKKWYKIVKIIKPLSLLFKCEFINKIEENNTSDWSGDIVLIVN